MPASAVFPGTREADTVVLDVTTEPLEMNSLRAYDVVSMNVLSHCIAGLTRLDENDSPVADMAERWDINEANTVYTIYLRKDAVWSNGDPITAQDYYFAWTMQLKPETGSYMVSYLYDNIKNGKAFYNGEVDASALGVELIDDYTLKIEWDQPKTDGLFLLSLPAYFPVNQKAYEAIGADNYAKDADKMITNGPYRMTEWVHDDHILLEKSDSYFNADSIQIPKVKLVMIGDSNTRLNAFMTGEIDLCNLYSEQITQVKDKDTAALNSYFDGGSYYFCFNTRNEYLQNKNLRQALAYSVDVQSLLDNVIADGSVAADGLIPPTIAGAGDKRYAEARGSLFAYDLNKAQSCMQTALSELGTSAADISLTLDVPNTPYNQNQAAYIQQQWQKNLGLNVTINAQPWNALQQAKWDGDYNISVEANSANENSAMSFLSTFTSDNTSDITGFANSEYDRLIEAAKVESDPQKKQEMMIQAETLLVENAVIGPLYFTCTTYAVSGKLDGLVRTPFQYFSVYNGASIRTS